MLVRVLEDLKDTSTSIFTFKLLIGQVTNDLKGVARHSLMDHESMHECTHMPPAMPVATRTSSMKLTWPGVSTMLRAKDLPEEDGISSDIGIALIDRRRFCSSYRVSVCTQSHGASSTIVYAQTQRALRHHQRGGYVYSEGRSPEGYVRDMYTVKAGVRNMYTVKAGLCIQ